MVYAGIMSKHHYMAGLIDGEGSVSLSHASNKHYRSPSIHVPSTTIEIVEWCKDNYGGYITNKKVYQEHHKPSFCWSLAKIDQLFECMRSIVPHMLEPEKVRRINLILSEYSEVTVRNGKYTDEQKARKIDFEERFLNR